MTSGDHPALLPYRNVQIAPLPHGERGDPGVQMRLKGVRLVSQQHSERHVRDQIAATVEQRQGVIQHERAGVPCRERDILRVRCTRRDCTLQIIHRQQRRLAVRVLSRQDPGMQSLCHPS